MHLNSGHRTIIVTTIFINRQLVLLSKVYIV